ncbi:hypothetical protein [Nostoc phage N1]|nr:hypothetical protein [Nostoc phage N1]
MIDSKTKTLALICLPVSTACLLFLVCQIALMNPKVSAFYNDFWDGFWNRITTNNRLFGE